MAGIVARGSSRGIDVCSLATKEYAELWRVKRLPYTFIVSDIAAAGEGAAWDVPEAVSVGARHCCVARCGGADARNGPGRIPDRKFAANYLLRPGGGGGVLRLAARRGPESAILAAGRMRAGRVGTGESRLDALRNRAARGASHGI